MNKSVELAVRISADAAGVASEFDKVSGSAKRMADSVDDASTKSEAAASRLDRVGSAAEGVDDKAGRATGALGALSSGFELVGMEKYAAGLQQASMATDFFSGLGQTANLVLETTRGAALKAKAATAAQAVATRAAAVATKVATAGQWLLNAALAANPVGIVVVAVLALVAAVVLAYKKSETFRTIVQAVMRAVRDAVGWVIDKIQFLAEKVGLSGDKWRALRDTAVAAASFIRDKVGAAFRALMTPIDAVIAAVKKVLDFIGKIKIPHISVPDLNPFNNDKDSSQSRLAPSSTSYSPTARLSSLAPTATVAYEPATVQPISITVNGALDPAAVGQQLIGLIKDQLTRTGQLTPLVQVAWT